MRGGRFTAGALLIAVVGGWGGSRAWGGQELTVDHRQITMLIRALGYEKQLKARAGAEVNVMVLGRADDELSERTAVAVSEAFSMHAPRAQGLRLVAAPFNFTTTADLTAELEARPADVLYLGRGLDGELPAIIALTRRKRILSLAGEQDYVGKGVSLGVFPLDGRAMVFVNLGASRKEGAAFAVELLRIAKVIR